MGAHGGGHGPHGAPRIKLSEINPNILIITMIAIDSWHELSIFLGDPKSKQSLENSRNDVESLKHITPIKDFQLPFRRSSWRNMESGYISLTTKLLFASKLLVH